MTDVVEVTTTREIRKGRILLFGREDNPAILPPDQFVRRFSLDIDKPSEWRMKFEQWCRGFIAETRKGNGLDVVVVDGISEFNIIDQMAHSEESGNSDNARRDTWNSVLEDEAVLVQNLNPTTLGCHVVFTARVMEKKKGNYNKKVGALEGADPEFMSWEYYPKLRGSFRFDLGAYFNYIFYIEQEVKPTMVGNKMVNEEVHVLHTLRDGDYLIKNIYKHVWPKDKGEMVNASFDDVLNVIKELSGGGVVKPSSFLIYGPPGGGKTAFGIGAFWRWLNE